MAHSLSIHYAPERNQWRVQCDTCNNTVRYLTDPEADLLRNQIIIRRRDRVSGIYPGIQDIEIEIVKVSHDIIINLYGAPDHEITSTKTS